jgi:hypothetical protein
MSTNRTPLEQLIDKACVREPDVPLEVKPCPFCGGQVMGIIQIGHPKADFWLMCMSSSDCTAGVFGMTLDECRRRWDSRV